MQTLIRWRRYRMSIVYEALCWMIDNKCSDTDKALEAVGFKALSLQEQHQICNLVIDQNEHLVEQINSGKTKAIGALIGKCKKENKNIDASYARRFFNQRFK